MSPVVPISRSRDLEADIRRHAQTRAYAAALAWDDMHMHMYMHE